MFNFILMVINKIKVITIIINIVEVLVSLFIIM